MTRGRASSRARNDREAGPARARNDGGASPARARNDGGAGCDRVRNDRRTQQFRLLAECGLTTKWKGYFVISTEASVASGVEKSPTPCIRKGSRSVWERHFLVRVGDSIRELTGTSDSETGRSGRKENESRNGDSDRSILGFASA